MKPTKTLRLPFLFIASLSVGLILVILFTRSQADKSINQLQLGTKEAIRVFKANQILDEIINGLYIAETSFQSGRQSTETGKADTLNKIKDQGNELQKLFQSTEVEKSTSQFNSLVQQQVTFFEKQRNSTDKQATGIQPLTDSIFISAVRLEEELGNYLQKNITGNEQLAVRVLRIDIILTVIIIITIALLATIIIGYLLRNVRLIRAIQQQRTEIEKAANIKEQFLANMSHEIRTPINSVIGFTNLLQKTELDHKQGSFVNMIKSAGENLLTIVNDILDISKIEAGMLHFDKSPFSINEACYQVETLLYQKANEKNLEIHTNIDSSVPDVVIGDKERLIQILMNLTSNAIKFTEQGGVTISVNVTNRTDRTASFLFSVKDTGIGIKEEKLSTIFQRFEQAETDTTRKYGGTGLGLAIVKNLVEMQGGNIRVLSEEGNGSEFEFNITYEVRDDIMLDFITSYNKNTVPVINNKNTQLSNVKILAAEDNKMNQMLLKMLFEQWQLNIEIVENGEIATEKLMNGNYDLVLMDIQMPVMDGYTAVRKIRTELKSKIPVIAMTANVLPGEKERCLDAGMTGYISKPINESELYSLLMLHGNQNNHINTEPRSTSNPDFINKDYLNRIFNGNSEFIKEMANQFIIQYAKELDTLGEHIKNKDASSANKLGHHMKTTVSSMNDQSPLIHSLMAIENASDSETGWNILNYNYDMLLKSREKVLEEAKKLIETGK